MALVADIWQANGWQVFIRPTQKPGHATELARFAAAESHQVVIAAGGDGTLCEVANGLAHTETTLAPLPVGTANSFGRELNLPRTGLWGRHTLLAATRALLNGRIHRVDLGCQDNGSEDKRYWLLWAGAGADGYLVDQVEPRPKWSKKLGRLGYMLNGVLLAPGYTGMRATVTVDGQVYKDDYLLVLACNCRLYAGGEVVLNPQAKLDDGLFELFLFRGTRVAQLFRLFIEAKLNRHFHNPNLTVVNGRHVQIQSQPEMPCQTDGERAGTTPLHCHIVPGALRLLVPQHAPRDLFEREGIRLQSL